MTASKRRRPPAALLLVTLDPARGLGLLRGERAQRVAWLLSPETTESAWSPAARGWVVTHDVAVDAVAYGQYRGLIVRVSHVPTTPTEASTP